MSRTEQVILTNMCMITDGRRILVQDKKSEKWPGVTFPGGKMELTELTVAGMEMVKQLFLSVFIVNENKNQIRRRRCR